MAEIATAVASEATAEAAKPLLARVRRQCEYVIFSDRYVGQLHKERQELKNAMARVRHSVDEALYNMKLIEADVENWLKEAETVAQKAGDVLAHKARDVLDDEGRAKKTCFCGWLLNPKARYCLGRDASKTVEAIPELIRQGKFEKVYYENDPPALVGGAAEVNSSASNGGHTMQELTARGQFEKVDFENPPTVLVGGASGVNSSAGDGGDFITGSRASIFQDIMKALDDEKLKVIGVYGPGGVGKTTLLKEVEKKLREARPFHMIVRVEVSQTPDLTNIRGQIADALSLDLKDKQTSQGKAHVLSKRLKSNPDEKVLVIFDNLWVKLDLEAVGIPWEDVSSKCKLLLTSRFKDVLEKEMGADRIFHLQGLTDGEASRLFENKVGDKLRDNEELKSIADQVVKKLAGLPLLIKSVATTLKSSDESAWRNALIEIDDSNKEKKETIVRLSYDHLKSKDAKYLFLLCGLIGGTIRVELLFVLAMGLGLFERFNKTMQDSRDRLNEMLNDLCSACLLLDGGNDKENVTIHDLYSEVAISTPFRDQNSLMMNNNNYLWSKEKPEKCWAIFLDDVSRDMLAELMLCQFPSLKILMLSMPKVWSWMPEHRHDVGDCSRLLDFTDMKELRVLYLRSMRITNLPPSIEILGNLRSLYLYNCNMKDVAIIGKLKALQILSFTRSTIDRLPKEMGELTNLRSLNLSDCTKLQRIEPGVLKRLIKLEELHMKGSFDQWMGKNEKPLELCNAGLADLRSMTKLNSLEISICDPNILLEVDDLPFENLTRFWINIGNVDGREFEGLRTMNIELKGHDNILSKTWVQKTLKKTQYLCLDGLGEFKNAYELYIQGNPQLKRLNILNSPSIKYIVSPSNSAFAILETLFLDNLINLEKISHGQIVSECFGKLEDVRVKECNRLEYLWSLSHMQNLVQLEKINVTNCNSILAIAGKDTVPTNCRVELPYLSFLYLAGLPNMRSFCSRVEMTSEGTPIQAGVEDEGGGDEGTKLVTTTSDLQNTYSDSFFDRKVSLPNLEHFKLDLVGSFKRIWPNKLSRSSFCKLATITVENCSNLIHIFPSTIVGRLHNLKSVEVRYCQSLKSLFDCGSLYSNMEQTTVLLPKLVSINVKMCPSLESLFNCGSLDSNVKDLKLDSVGSFKRIWHDKSFCKLATITVKICSNLLHIFPSTIIGRLHKLESVEVSNCPHLKSLFDFGFVDSNTEHNTILLPQLVRINVKSCPSLESLFNCGSLDSNVKDLKLDSVGSFKRIWHDKSFCKLATITVKSCSNLLHIFPSTIIGRLHKLKSVEVLHCPHLKSLFDFGSLDSNTEQNTVLLPQLVRIDVKICPSLESLFNCGFLDSNAEHKIILLPKLEEVWVSRAKKLRNLVMSHSQMVLNFPRLRIVNIENCSDLRYLFPKYTATTLMKLEWLTISKCKRMKEVILEKEVGQSEAKVMSFPCLSQLTLKELDKLISFESGSVKRQLGETAEGNDESPQPLFNEMVTFSNMRYLEIEGVSCKKLWNNYVPADSIVCSHRFLLENVKVKKCPSLKSLFDFGSLDSNTKQNVVLLPQLVRIDVESCHSLESLFNCGSLDSNVEHTIILFPKLEKVRVSRAKKLRQLVMSHSQMVLNFPSLRTIGVENCSNLRYLFSKYTATSLMKLNMLEISKCERMKEVILEEEVGQSEGEVMSFPCLSELTLEELNNFAAFISSPTSVKRQLGKITEENDESPQLLFNEMVAFPNITSLEITGLRCKELWNNQIPTNSFQKLKYLKLKNCDNLQHIATSYMWKKLQCCLKELEAISCRSIEIIYEGDGTDIESGKLSRLVLRDLENLRCIWQSDSLPNIPFPNLGDVEAVRCPCLEMLFPTFTVKFLGQIEKLVVASCEDMKQIAGHEKLKEGTCTTITFSKLTVLMLLKLPKFRRFFLPEKYSLKFPCSENFPSLRALSIKSCGAEPDIDLCDIALHQMVPEHHGIFARVISVDVSCHQESIASHHTTWHAEK